jgi:8-oxo-dGTP pyrophosphatase MutT (NUDIX family)
MTDNTPLIKRTTHFRGRVVSLTVDEVTLPNGHRTGLEIVHHPGGAGIVAVDDQKRVCLLRQYRHAVNGWILELPAGKLEPNEPPLSTAQRELVEEAGMQGAQWDSLGQMFPSPGVLTEVVHLYLATDLMPAEARPEAAEVFEIQWVPLQQAFAWTLDGTIDDAKSVIGLTRAMYHPTFHGLRPGS